jgi:SsrA-binding protein
MKKKPTGIVNKRARFDYEIERTLIAGISLTGAETKSLRMGHGILRGAYVQIKDDGAWLINLQVNPIVTNRAHLHEESRTRSRRLLIKTRELEELQKEKSLGRQVVPTKMLTKGRFIKVELGVGAGKKMYDKRETIKRRDTERIEAARFKR